MTMPEQKRGQSKQDYGTPPELIRALVKRFGELHVDLAASDDNTVCDHWVTPETDSLKQDWPVDWGFHQCWLNPPFANIEPWAKKCADFGRRSKLGRLFLLTPASIGSNWYAEHVHRKAYVMALNGRVTFVGETQAYPKDVIISIFGARIAGFEVWDWRKE